MEKRNLLEFSFAELQRFCTDLGEKPFRAKQIWSWLWSAGVREFAEMTNISKAFRAILEKKSLIAWPVIADRQESLDGTSKFLLELEDGALIESVIIPEAKHCTQCLSVQVGCPMGCLFCCTGQSGFTRNLSQAEILGQVLLAREWLRKENPSITLRNIVFMGMGEPLLNLDNVLRALQIMTDPLALNFSHRRITVSTVGLPEQLKILGENSLAALAVSLHAPSQSIREQIMPIAAKVPLEQLMMSLRDFPLKLNKRITFEYLLLKGVNDSVQHARQLAKLIAPFKAKVNLIAYNPGGLASAADEHEGYRAPSTEDILQFQKILWEKGIITILRKSKGADIEAACGQLKNRHDNKYLKCGSARNPLS